MKRLAIIITQAEMGGAQKNILLLAKDLKNEYDITVYSGEKGALSDELNNINIKHISVPSLVREINPIKDLNAFRFFVNEFKKNNYDIVHSHSSKAGIIARLAAKTAKVENNIFTAHGFVFNEPMNSIKKNIYIFLEKFAGRNCDTIICVDPNDIKLAEKYKIKPKKSIIYIPNGISFKENSSVIKKDNIFTFGLVANFYETKGHRYLIEAFKEFTKESPIKTRLVLIGDGILRKEMEALAKENKNIEFWGYKSNAMNLMNHLDAFILSSVKEGFPFVLLEAIKNKIPIISTDVGAIREMLDNGKNGLIVQAKNVEELKKAMHYSISNKEEMVHKAINAYESCKKKYSLEAMIELTKKVYENK